uniref:Uncharacterized protein n=1 Tax=Plectus sambesii TaxID=2011161 RepID=A0A914XDC8_9BILA
MNTQKTTRAAQKVRSAQQNQTDDNLNMSPLLDASPLKRAPQANDQSLSGRKKRRTDVSQLFAKFADAPIADKLTVMEGSYLIQVVELGPLLSVAHRGGVHVQRMARVVDSSTCFLLQLNNTHWAKQLLEGERYVLCKPSVDERGVMIVPDGADTAICKGMPGGTLCEATTEDLASILESVEKKFSKTLAALCALGGDSGLHTVRAKVVDMGKLGTTKTRFGTITDVLSLTIQDGPDAVADRMDLTIWGALARASADVLQTGACFSISCVVAKKFGGKVVLNATANTVMTPVFDTSLVNIEQGQPVTTTVEAEILSYNPTSAVVWPRCPTPTCNSKNLTEQTDGSFICGTSQRQPGCAGVFWSDDVLVGATIAVMEVVDGRPESFDQYKIYTKSVARLTPLPTVYRKSFDLSQIFDKIDFPVYAKVRLLTNTEEKALEIEMVEPDEEDEEDEEF